MRTAPPVQRAVSATIAMMVASIGAAMSGPSVSAQPQSEDVLDAVRLDQRIGGTVPLDVPFTDEEGETIELGSLVTDRPVILVPVFYRCPMLCSQILNALVRTVAGQSLMPGEDFRVVVFSIDPRETHELAVEAKLQFLRRMPRADARRGWHFLVGRAEAIRRITNAIGYGYAYDAEADRFAHPAAAAILTSDAVISRYLVGLEYDPGDLRLSLVEASSGEVGTLVDQVLLRCYSYDPEHGRYGFAIMAAVRIGGVLTLLAIGAGLLWMARRRPTSAGAEVGEGI